MRLKNTYSNQLETFEPLDPDGKRVTIHSCGPTVWSFAHIGNFRSFLFADVLRRTLELKGFEVCQVMNITDVGHMTEDHLADAGGEDKLAKIARELGTDPFAVAAHFESVFALDAKTLRLRLYEGEDAENAALHPRATRYIPEMLAMISRLLESGHAYCDSAGQVYFDISTFPEYGELSGKDIDELEEGKRVEVRSEKRDPRDFALWKADDKHLMKWDPHNAEGWHHAGDYERLLALLPSGIDSRVGVGFPGWHIECSAMSAATLGEPIDIHTGGEDNIFPHHECEVAQSYGAGGTTVAAPSGAADAGEPRKTFARYWVHGRHLLVDGRKMSKRDGTFFTVRDMLDPMKAERPELAGKLRAMGFSEGRVPANVLRYSLISNQYTQPMNFTLEGLEAARVNLERLQSLFDRLTEIAGEGDVGDVGRVAVLKHRAAFLEALEDNLNMPRALAAVFAFVGDVNAMDASPGEARAALEILADFDHVLAVLDRERQAHFTTTEQLRALEAEPITALLAPDRDVAADREVECLLANRARARREKDWSRADTIRDRLAVLGITTEDTPAGVRWKRSKPEPD